MFSGWWGPFTSKPFQQPPLSAFLIAEPLKAVVFSLVGSWSRCELHTGMNDRVTTDQIVPNPSKLFSKDSGKEK